MRKNRIPSTPDMQAYFQKAGILHGQRQHYLERPEQMKMAEAVFQCMEKADALRGSQCAIVPIQGDTGIGKSLAALIPMLHKVAQHRQRGEQVRGGYATFTTQLRRQLAGNDLQTALLAVKEKTGITLTTAEYWGAGHYLSAKSLQAALLKTLPGHVLERIARILTWMEDMGDALLIQAKTALYIEEHEPLVPGYPDSAWACSWREALDLPAYQAMKDAVRTADILLLSHAAALVNAQRWFSLLNTRVGGELRYVVFDEAHRLPDAAQSLTDQTLSLSRLVRTLEIAHEQSIGKVNVHMVKQARGLRDALQGNDTTASDTPEGIAGESFVLHHQSIPGGEGETVQDVLKKQDVQGLYRDIQESLKGMNPASLSIAGLSALWDLYTVRDVLGDYLSVLDKAQGNPYQLKAGVSWSPYLRQPSLRMTSTQPGRLVARYWRHYAGQDAPEDARDSQLWGAVILSATLPDLPEIGIFDPLKKELVEKAWQKPPFLMVPSIHDSLVFEPKQFGEMHFILSSLRAPDTMRQPGEKREANERWTNPAWEKAHLLPMVDAMVQTATAEDGLLILAQSHKEVRMIAEHALQQDWAHRVIVDDENTTLAGCSAQFRSKRGHILITAGGWEGLDLPGMIQHLMITRLPRSPRDDAWKEILLEKHDEDKANRILSYRMQRQMLAKLRQGLGRGIRGKYDHVTVWIADKRFGLPEAVVMLNDPRAIDPERQGKVTDKVFWEAIPARFRPALMHARVFSAEQGVFIPEAPKNLNQPRLLGDSLLSFLQEKELEDA